VITTPGQLHYIATSRVAEERFWSGPQPQFCIQHQGFYIKINQAGKQAKQADDFGQASKLKVSKIASQEAEPAQLGLLVYYQLCK